MSLRTIRHHAADLAMRRTNSADQEELRCIAAALAALCSATTEPLGELKVVDYWETRIAHMLAIADCVRVLALRSHTPADLAAIKAITRALDALLTDARARRRELTATRGERYRKH